MAKVRKLDVGPVVGETTASSVRLFGRVARPASWRHSRHGAGRVALRLAGQAWQAPRHFRFSRNFDDSGVYVWTGLKPDSEYEYRIGWVSPSDVPDAQLDWDEANSGRFRTMAEAGDAPLRFALGSCLYPYLLSGEHRDERTDKAFRSLLQDFVQKGRAIDFQLLLGDLLYNDHLNRFTPDLAESFSEFCAKYRDLYRQPHLRKLLANLPSYMMLDDHEIEDNFPAKRHRSGAHMAKMLNGLRAYRVYQASHSPIYRHDAEGYLQRQTDDREPDLDYCYQAGCAEFFILNTRTERRAEDAPPSMLGEAQLQRLLCWLQEDSGRIKFVGSGVPFFPDAYKQYSRTTGRRSWKEKRPTHDGWADYVEQRNQIMECILDLQQPRVVFLGGDVHAHLSCGLRHRLKPQSPVYSLVSSGLFWPENLFFDMARWQDHQVERNRPLWGNDDLQLFTQPGLDLFSNANGFTIIEVAPEGIRAQLHNTHGKALKGGETLIRFG